MDDFDRFWKCYPKKLAKADARKAWEQTAKVRPDIETLIKSVIVASSQEQWTQLNGKFIPYAASWLRGERWEDIHEVELQGVVNGKMWFETVTGIETKGAEIGLTPRDFDFDWQKFRAEVLRRMTNVIQMKA